MPHAVDSAWSLIRAAASLAEAQAGAGRETAFGPDGEGGVQRVPAGDWAARILWRPGLGWEPVLSPDDPLRPLLDLYLPFCSATTARPITLGHLGQSLDGFIATHGGESHWVTGPENILHMHRLRALCDAVVVGGGTVAADNPLLTTRLVAGPNPLRVVLDPRRRLGTHYRVFTDTAAETLYVCSQSPGQPPDVQHGLATVVTVAGGEGGLDAAAVISMLRARGCARIFVEGGGATVSRFLDANLLDYLQITVAPLIIGDGRPAIRLPPRAALRECRRPRHRVFRMGDDVLFDCELHSQGAAEPAEGPAASHPLVRVQ